MRANRKSYWTLGWIVIVFLTRCAGSAWAADAIHPTASVFIDMNNTAGVPEDILSKAEKEAEKIYREIGIHLVWAPDPDASVRLTVVLAPEDKAGFFLDTEERAGRAVGSEGRGARRAYVFPKRVKDSILRSIDASEAKVLGAVIAHEIGHLLLPPNAHSALGIMRAAFRVCDFDRPDMGGIRFTAEQGSQIRTIVRQLQSTDKAKGPDSSGPSLLEF